MRIVFRADASVWMGTGHVMRCLTLADELHRGGAEIHFACRDEEGSLCDYIETQRGYPVLRMPPAGPTPELGTYAWEADAAAFDAAIQAVPAPIDWLVVDHYGLDARWETAARRFVGRVMAIDDLADRPHACEVLLDQNYADGYETRYSGLVPEGCKLLLGPDHALLRPDFVAERERLAPRDGALDRVLVLFGGSDPTNETHKALTALRRLARPGLAVDAIAGASNPHRLALAELCAAEPGFTLHVQVEDMALRMARADLAIGAGGGTMWERCCLGLPALLAILADNQAPSTTAVARQGAIINLGWARDLTVEDYEAAIRALTPDTLRAMSRQGLQLVDGRGCARVAAALLSQE